MRISDWSSDVCSSDLLEPDVPAERLCRPAVDRKRMAAEDGAQDQPDVGGAAGTPSGSHDRRPCRRDGPRLACRDTTHLPLSRCRPRHRGGLYDGLYDSVRPGAKTTVVHVSAVNLPDRPM